MKPYIFLTENYLKHAIDSNNNTIDAVNLSASSLPYTLTLFFTDRYGNAVNRTIDTLILQKTNIQNMTVSAYNGNAPYTLYAWTYDGHTIYTKNQVIAIDPPGEPLFNSDGTPYTGTQFHWAAGVILYKEEPHTSDYATTYDSDLNITIEPYDTIFNIVNNTENTIILKNENATITSRLKITIPDTNNPASVYGTLGVYNFLCNLFALTDSDYRNEANEGGYRVVDGSYIHFGDYNKWAAKVKMENLPKAQFDLLTNQAKQVGELTAIPYEDLEASAIYECAVNRGFSWGVDRKTELFNLTLELNEL